MTTSALHRSKGKGLTLLSFGFRPFFLLGAIWAAIAVPLWIAVYVHGPGAVPVNIGLVWHTHEMVFGYGSAIVAGFLLTAIPSWTKRPPIAGGLLAILVLLWCAGRIFYLLMPQPSLVSAAVESSFLLALAVLVGREILVSRNTRNLKVAMAVFLFAAANAAFHVSVTRVGGLPQGAIDAGLAVLLWLILLVGGRIVPSFTRNWLAKHRPGALPVVFGRYDALVLVISGAALAAWLVSDVHLIVGGLLTLAGLMNAIRLYRWRGWRTVGEPLVLILHVGYAWAVIGLLGLGLHALMPDIVPRLASIHALGTGAIGVMTLAVMTRATLGHTGRALMAGGATVAVFLSVNLAALVRVAATFLGPGMQAWGNTIATLFWVLAFATFVIVYGPRLLAPRIASAA
ncbi:MAG: NnrS family protein [Hyphomonadaceae bacterium]|nr:NnrS family protein [Hyphomonadaceae bacterium]